MIPLARLLLIAALLGAGARANPELTGVDLELVAEKTSIQAGQAFRVGLRIRHHDGYHSYWRNPGIVGVPTSLEWTLPEGFTAGPIQWPYPEMVDMAGHPAHGYHRDVLLMVEMTPPATVAAENITLKATVNWMACAKTCHPGTTTLSLTLPVSGGAGETAHAPLFKKASAELPEALEAFTPKVLTAPDAPKIRVLLTPRTPTPKLKELYFFSTDGQVSSNEAQTLRLLKGGRYLLTLIRSEFGPQGRKTLPGVLQATPAKAPENTSFTSIRPVYPDRKGVPDK